MTNDDEYWPDAYRELGQCNDGYVRIPIDTTFEPLFELEEPYLTIWFDYIWIIMKMQDRRKASAAWKWNNR